MPVSDTCIFTHLPEASFDVDENWVVGNASVLFDVDIIVNNNINPMIALVFI